MRKPLLRSFILGGTLCLTACGMEGADASATPSEDLASTQLELSSRSKLVDHVARTHGGRSADRLEVKATRLHRDMEGVNHARYQQMLRGVPVFGAEAIVHTRDDGSTFAMTDNLVPDVDVSTQPTLSALNAMDLAVARLGCNDCLTEQPEAELVVLPREGRTHLAYRVQLRREDGTEHTSMPVSFVDAHTGDVVWSYDNLQTATGTGASLYSGNVSVDTYFKSSTATYYLEDLGRKVGTWDVRNRTDFLNIILATAYPITDTDNVWDTAVQRAAVDAHWGAEKVMDYYSAVHGRNGLNGSGGPTYYTSGDGVTKLISSRVHYGSNYNNAFWNGKFMTYGDGNGTSFSALVTLDIAGHEMTHGVTEFTAKLTYSNESGALNESMSDVFGAMVERYVKGESANTWLIGEEAYTPATAGDALRYMNDPHLAGNAGYTSNDDPDHYSERYTGTGDNGGVHINSGIGNKAFYLCAMGGTHHLGGSMTGIGADKCAAIWYRALTSYMTSSTNFAGARTATLNAATALYGSGSAEYSAVANCWTLVGVN